ncbi:helix-turn-helix domain-containing protein [Paenibacillus macquariensis]|uniref:AraC family transcriptional regulator, arabinose operon regulatory protein n=1 Tax=Paenibacillus macquariensis TaxID=948756 RepID=A0ABY1KE53_9BACL|nr:helix-turn-helix domain-containing protein [Paenibacillus macquariensis]MEC0093831.1 helix-turn-helix domain-containing protein [Paenibacillus macquariensis]OAB38881.1 AraC family transcriptional regulator [Paenibacillus macquariensis subsp. macquariensis]SIR69426.1 AraC family transcriptional regulator, arabinose operon regulatory protein [Paenibacillus macquariensis]
MKFSNEGKYSFHVSTGTIISGHFQENDTYVTRRPKGMSDWLIVYTLDGEGYFQTPSGEKTCGEGDITLLKADVPHKYGTCPGSKWNFLWAHFPRLSEVALLPDEEVFISKIINEHIRKRIYRSFKRVLRDSREGTVLWHELCENAIREILLLVAEGLNDKFDPRIKQIMHILSQKMVDPIRIEDLAKSVCLSSSRLSHLFKHETGETILEALHRMRLRQAALLLKHTDRTASDVALDVGFHSYNHFAELFRLQFGISPRNYKSSL